MGKIGLLLITTCTSLSKLRCEALLKFAAACINQKLYVSFDFTDPVKSDEKVFNFIAECYHKAYSLCRHLDVRVCLAALRTSQSSNENFRQILRQCDTLLLDEDNDQARLTHWKRLAGIGDIRTLPKFEQHSGDDVNDSLPDTFAISDGFSSQKPVFAKYEGVVLGGTFDRLHNGHKILLSCATLLAKDHLVVGVTDGPMLANKVLSDLIEPSSLRIANVHAFLKDVEPSLDYQIVPIQDPFGPSVTEPNLQCIVASQETERGARKVCSMRTQKGLNSLDVFVITLADGDDPALSALPDEHKIGSTRVRHNLLGTLLQPVIPKVHLEPKPYIIGLTGGICSGKSNIADYLRSLGAWVIDCDKLGHAAYVSGTECYQQVIDAFGNDIIDAETHQINRRNLAAKVFGSAEQLQRLNSIVWPAIAQAVTHEIVQARNNGSEIVVVDAAVLLEAGWDALVHEVWVTFVPKEEAVRRMHTRNGISVEDAERRLAAQKSNRERIDRANVVFCSLWEYEYTRGQVKKAWTRIKEHVADHS